jgi:predicted AAA+ superfamily ATPase
MPLPPPSRRLAHDRVDLRIGRTRRTHAAAPQPLHVASLPTFQRTRGVLKLMANVVGVLWQQQAKDPLITPARVPVANERVRASLLYPLDGGFNAVVDREVDGDGSLPAQLEANPSRRITQARAATRAARAIFLATAPHAGGPNAGMLGPVPMFISKRFLTAAAIFA